MLTEVPAESPETPLPESVEAETVTSADENDANGQEIETPAVPLVTDVPQKPGFSWEALASPKLPSSSIFDLLCS